jgi:hypothetical protein
MHKKHGVTIVFNNTEIFMESAMIGGVINEEKGEMMGVYCGHRDIGDLGVAVLQVMRGGLKTARDEFGLNLDAAVDFMTFTLGEAIRREVQSGHKTETVFREVRRNNN